MIVWATEFPCAAGTTATQVLDLCEEWLIESPHHAWTAADFPAVYQGEIARKEHNGEVLSIARVSSDEANWTGLQHTWTEAGLREWTIEVVARERGTTCVVALRVDCTLLVPGSELPVSKKPYLVKLLMQRLGGGADSWLAVSDTPTRLEEGQVADAAAIISGTTDVRLPIVYVSAAADHKPFLQPGSLARALSGMAHVVVEPSRHFSFVLAREVNRSNPYGGAVGVLWPMAVEPCTRFLMRQFKSQREMAIAVSARVQEALVTTRPTAELTWVFLRELSSRQRIDQLKSQGSTAVSEYAAAFDTELAVKEERLAEANAEIAKLQSELRRFSAASGGPGMLLAPGEEKEFYSGETADALLFALRLAVTGLNESGRRRHLVEGVLAANEPTDLEEEYTREIKRIFATQGDLTGTARADLEALGFSVSADGKHNKAIYQGDGRYTFTFSKSSSEYRAGKNAAAQLLRTLFK